MAEGYDVNGMKLCRFQTAKGVSFGVVEENEFYDMTSVDAKMFHDMESAHVEALKQKVTLSELVTSKVNDASRTKYDEKLLRIPVVPTEVWGAGVTYVRSKEARERETKMKGLYDYVYSAPRPEVFFKDSGLRCRGPGEEVCIRSDSEWTVPEPELTLVLDGDASIAGYTIGNDVSSRDIEGENPLYLPQAKIYKGSCAVGPVVTTSDEITNPHSLQIEMRILRAGTVAFEGRVSTSQLNRRVGELTEFLKRDNVLRTFTLLMTGTSLVPADQFRLQDDDLVEIEIEKIGVLRNPVKKL